MHGAVRLEKRGRIARVVLDRPGIRNAFNEKMIEDLLEVFRAFRNDTETRAVVLTGEGQAFCAGADLHWMKRVVEYTFEENVRDSLRLAEMLHEVYNCPKPVIGSVNGHAVGGGAGLVAVCDISIADERAEFAFTETKLGLAPAVISPFLLKRMGERNLRRLFLTGERFNAARAVEYGLINEAVPPERLDARLGEVLDAVLTGGPEALEASKNLIRDVTERDLRDNKQYTAELIARLRLSGEGQEGMKAFLEKREPAWSPDSEGES